MAIISHKYQLVKRLLFIHQRSIPHNLNVERFAIFKTHTHDNIFRIDDDPNDNSRTAIRQYLHFLDVPFRYYTNSPTKYRALIWNRSFSVIENHKLV